MEKDWRNPVPTFGASGDRGSLSLVPAFALGLSVAICHGIGRFAYPLLMPAMMGELGWSYDQASWMNTANALGYLLGTLTGFVLLRSHSATRIFRTGVVLTCASVLLMAFSLGFWWFILVRLLSGIGAAWAFSTGAAIVGTLYSDRPERKGAATALFFGSAGLGMILSGASVPAILEFRGANSWPLAWMLLGLVCCVLAPFPIRQAVVSRRASIEGQRRIALRALAPSSVAMLGYFGFAAAHTGYIFFIFAWTKAQALPWHYGASMWVVLGIGILFSSTLWKKPMDRWSGPRILAACSFAVALGASLPLVHLSLGSVYLSAFLVGSSLFIGPSSMAVLARQSLPQQFWSSGLMVFSAVFSIGQSIASWGFGLAADRYSLGAVLSASSVGLVIASLVAALDRRSLR